MKKVILITGASSGIGLATAKLLHNKGYTVYGAARSIEEKEVSFHKVNMDINDELSVKRGVDEIIVKESKIDVLINGAGFAVFSAFEHISMKDLRAQFETNFFGHLSLTQYVLKQSMIPNTSGLVLTIGSIGGMIGLPYQSAYSATKFALEGFMEAIRIELKQYQIKIVLLDPGDVNTDIYLNRKVPDSPTKRVYGDEQSQKTLKIIEGDEKSGLHPDVIARQIEAILRSKSPKLRYIKGPFLQELVVQLKKILPQGLFEWLITDHYGINHKQEAKKTGRKK